MEDLVQDEFVEKELPLELRGMADVDLPVKTGVRFVGAAVLLLCSYDEDDGVEVGKIEMVSPAEYHILKEAEGEPWGGVVIEVMKDGIFFWILVVGTDRML